MTVKLEVFNSCFAGTGDYTLGVRGIRKDLQPKIKNPPLPTKEVLYLKDQTKAWMYSSEQGTNSVSRVVVNLVCSLHEY